MDAIIEDTLAITRFSFLITPLSKQADGTDKSPLQIMQGNASEKELESVMRAARQLGN